MLRHVLPGILMSLALSGCGLSANAGSPLAAEDRVVSPVPNDTRVITLNEPEVWTDQSPPLVPATHGIRLPSGRYILEAEDANSLYFRSPEKIEYRIFANGAVTDDRFMPGGLFLSKATFASVPAGAYLTVDAANKTVTWKLGSDFLAMEGTKWSKNF
jgi:hypothetical protein